MDRSKTVWSQRETLDDEIGNLQRLRGGPHIITLYETFRQDKYCYLVLELMKGGHLFDRLVAKKMYTEKEARDACLGLLKGVEFMHEKSIVHRDLKPENLLLVVRIRLRKKKRKRLSGICHFLTAYSAGL